MHSVQLRTPLLRKQDSALLAIAQQMQMGDLLSPGADSVFLLATTGAGSVFFLAMIVAQ